MNSHHQSAWGIGPGERAALILVATAASIVGTLWFAFALSALAFGDGWPSISLVELAKGLYRLPSHLDDPAKAFEPPLRRALSGPVGFYFTLAALFAGPLVAAVALRRLVGGGRLPRIGRKRHAPSARWASRRDLRPLSVDAASPGRIVLGRFGRRLVATEPLQSVLVVAPPRSHKTTGLAIPAALEHDGPLISTSIRGDVVEATLARRQELGEVMIFDPTGSTGLPSAAWSPLGSSHTWRGAQRMAFWLCSVSRSKRGEIADADFWFKAAAKLLAPHLLAAARSGAQIADVIRWIDTQEEEEVAEALSAAEQPDALRAFAATLGRDERQRSSIYTTVETVLDAYADPKVLHSARAAEITPARLLDGGANTLYLCGPPHEQERLAPLFAALLEEVIAVAYESSSALGAPLERPLLLLGDELANIAPIRSLPTLASTGAGQGIQLVSIFQDLAQIEERWGKSWRTVANSHRARLFGTGSGDPHTLDYVRQLSGESEFGQDSRTHSDYGQGSKTESVNWRSITPAHVVREADPGTALLLYGHLPPAKLKLRPYFSDRGLLSLAEGEGRRSGPDRSAEDLGELASDPEQAISDDGVAPPSVASESPAGGLGGAAHRLRGHLVRKRS